MTNPIFSSNQNPNARLPSLSSAWSIRLFLVCLVAVSVSLPMAWISLAKVIVFVFCLLYLSARLVGKRREPVFSGLWTPWAILAILLAFSLSLLWTGASQEVALSTFVKHSKLLEIAVLVSLIRTAPEARIAITTFAAGQALLLLTSWLMVAGIPIPWATSVGYKYVVFSTYLDESIIFATTAAVFWHLRSAHLWPYWLAALLAAVALLNVFLLLEGRTGYAVAMTVLSLSVMWAVPRRLRLATLVATPVIVLLSLYFGSTQVQERVSKVILESQDYVRSGVSESSSGWRLNAWHRSIEAIREKPLLGHGVGSWTMSVKGLEGSSATHVFGEGQASNPHQEYLLWGVELGIGGLLLLVALIACMVRDARRFETSIARAIVSVVASMAVACMFNSTLYDALIGDYFCVALGLLMALGLRNRPTSSGRSMPAPGLKNLKVAT